MRGLVEAPCYLERRCVADVALVDEAESSYAAPMLAQPRVALQEAERFLSA